jgi:nuclear RNA export factor
LSHYLRNVINLSFANNLISNSASFKAALGGLSNLREVVLQGNPIREEAMGRNRESVYRKEIADMFPSLQFLDTKPVVERSPGAAGITQTSEQVKFGQLSAGAVEQKSKERRFTS